MTSHYRHIPLPSQDDTAAPKTRKGHPVVSALVWLTILVVAFGFLGIIGLVLGIAIWSGYTASMRGQKLRRRPGTYIKYDTWQVRSTEDAPLEPQHPYDNV